MGDDSSAQGSATGVHPAVHALHNLYVGQLRTIELCQFIKSSLLEGNSDGGGSPDPGRSGDVPVLDEGRLPLGATERGAIFGNLTELCEAIEPVAMHLHHVFTVWDGTKAQLRASFTESALRFKDVGFQPRSLPTSAAPPMFRGAAESRVPSVEGTIAKIFGFERGAGVGGESTTEDGPSAPGTSAASPMITVFSPAELAGNPAAAGGGSFGGTSAPVSPTSGRAVLAESFGHAVSEDDEEDGSEMRSHPRGGVARLLQEAHQYAVHFTRRAAPTLHALATGQVACGKHGDGEVGAVPVARAHDFIEAVSAALSSASFRETHLPERDPLAVGGSNDVKNDTQAVVELTALLATPLWTAHNFISTAIVLQSQLMTTAGAKDSQLAALAAQLGSFVRHSRRSAVLSTVGETVDTLAELSAVDVISRFDPSSNVKVPPHPGRKLLHRGNLGKKYSRGRHNRVFVLFSDCVVYGENPADESTVIGQPSVGPSASGSASAFTAPPLSRSADGSDSSVRRPSLRIVGYYSLLTTQGTPAVEVVDLRDNPASGLCHSMQLTLTAPKKKALELSAGSSAEKREWLAALKFAVDEAVARHKMASANKNTDDDTMHSMQVLVENPRNQAGIPLNPSSPFDVQEAKRRHAAAASVLPLAPAVFLPAAAQPTQGSSGGLTGGGALLSSAQAASGTFGGVLSACDELSHVSGVFGETRTHAQQSERAAGLLSDDATMTEEHAMRPGGAGDAASFGATGHDVSMADAGVPPVLSPGAVGSTQRSSKAAAAAPQRLGRLARQRRDGLAASSRPAASPRVTTLSSVRPVRSLAQITLPLAPRPTQPASGSGAVTPSAATPSHHTQASPEPPRQPESPVPAAAQQSGVFTGSAISGGVTPAGQTPQPSAAQSPALPSAVPPPSHVDPVLDVLGAGPADYTV